MESGYATLRVAMYSHDTFGLGHITRTLRLAGAIVEAVPSASVLVLTGSPIANRLTFPKGVEYVKLPSVRKCGPEEYAPRDLDIPFWRLRQMRVDILRDSIRLFQPHLLFVDNVPLGMKGEVLPVLELMARRRREGARVHLNLRDILDEPETLRATWREIGAYHALDSLYDEVHVFGDPAIHDAVRAYDLPRRRTTYFGYLAPVGNIDAREEGRPRVERAAAPSRILVTIGGGDDGAENVRCVLAMQQRDPQGRRYSLDIVLGPFVNPDQRWEVERDLEGLKGVRVREYVEDLCRSMSDYDVVLSMGGYNTLCEVMALARRSVVIPRVYPRREQEMRARALEARGVLRVMHPGEASSERLARVLEESLERGPVLPSSSAPPLDGLARFKAKLRSLATGLRVPTYGAARQDVRRGRRRADVLRQVALALALLLPGTPEAFADIRPKEASVEVLMGYDTNILDASDAEIEAFHTGDPGNFFVVRRIADAVGLLNLRAEWPTRTFGQRSLMRLGYERRQYVHESIRSENHYAFLWRTRVGARTVAGLGVAFAPEIYGRHRRDKDAGPGEPLFRAETRSEWDAEIALEQGLHQGLVSRVGAEATIRNYNTAFDERDRWRVGGFTGLGWRSTGGARIDLTGGYRRQQSRNEPYLGSDLSYREWSLRSILSCERCLGSSLGFRGHVKRDWTAYTSTDPDDESHFGREDAEWEIGALVVQPISKSLEWKAAAVHGWRSSEVPPSAAGEFDVDEGSYKDTFVTTGLAWHWLR